MEIVFSIFRIVSMWNFLCAWNSFYAIFSFDKIKIRDNNNRICQFVLNPDKSIDIDHVRVYVPGIQGIYYDDNDGEIRVVVQLVDNYFISTE